MGFSMGFPWFSYVFLCVHSWKHHETWATWAWEGPTDLGGSIFFNRGEKSNQHVGTISNLFNRCNTDVTLYVTVANHPFIII